MNTSTPPPRRFAVAPDRIFDGTRMLTGLALIVDGDSIAAAVPRRELPPDIPTREAPGCTALPGLVDMHVHFMRWQGPLYLAWGVTTIRDVANPLDWILARRAEWPRHTWPRIYATGPQLEGPAPYWRVGRACADGADAERAVRELAAAGVDSIKLYASLPPEWLRGMAAAAHEAGLKTSIHSQRASVMDAGLAGVDEFHHLDGTLKVFWPDHPPGWLELWGHPDCERRLGEQQRLADRIRAFGLAATPTLAYWDSRRRAGDPGFPAPDDLAALPPTVRDWVGLPYRKRPTTDQADTWDRAVRAAQQFTGYLMERDVPILAGTDVPWILPGVSLWRELALLVESGMPPIRALQTATHDAARWLGAERIGRLDAGCIADIVLVKGDPSTRIPERPDIEAVIRGGEWLQPADLLAAARTEGADVEHDPWGPEFARAFSAKP